jgi:hypothetical protein
MWTQALQKVISSFVRKQFDNLRLNLLGPEYVSAKTMTFSFEKFDPLTTLSANYLHANALNSIEPDSVDKDTIDKIRAVAEHYINSLEQKSLADTNRIISSQIDDLILEAKREDRALRDVLTEKVGQDMLKNIKSELQQQKVRLDRAVDTLVTHELHNAQNAGALDGIIGASKSLGIDDPVVFKIGVLDDKRCKYCWKLWTLPDKVTPKVYKLSELSGSPGNPKNPGPSVSPTHVNCRDVLTVLMPGFSFDETGYVKYVGNNHNEWEAQRKK